ncbi:hypothetical protein FIU93_21315 [Labrenzia sp. THAF35]|nr:hypothetical protein FIU93_21315 [Labrenzia sp. THAF35]
MSIEVLDLIAHGTPYAATGLSGLCIAAVFWMQHRQGVNKPRSRSSNSLIFGQWPNLSCPVDSNADATSPSLHSGRFGRSVGSSAPAGPFSLINRTQIRTAPPHRRAEASCPQAERTAE